MGLRRGGWVGVALVVALLAGCSGDAEKKPSGLVTPSASSTLKATTSDVPTVPPWPVRPQYPDAARRQDAAGAEAAFQYFLVGVGYGFRTGNPSVIREVSAPTCEYCKNFEKLITSLEESKRLFVGADPSHRRVGDVANASTELATMNTVVSQGKSVLMDQSGSVLKRESASSTTMRVSLIWARDHWMVFSIKIVKR